MFQVEKTVFISYRRTDIFTARSVHQNLTKDGYDVFLDFENIDSGSFEAVIVKQIAARAHFVVILTPTALERCAKPDDWLRREIEQAIDLKRNIVPLMFQDFEFHKSSQYLTGKLSLLTQYNGIKVPADFFEEAMSRLKNRFLNKPLEVILHPMPHYVELKATPNEETNKSRSSVITEGKAKISTNCSVEGTTPVLMRFVNKRNKVLDIYWINYTCEEVHYLTLNPGDSRLQKTFVTHPWVIRDQESGVEIDRIIPKSDDPLTVLIE